MSESTQTQTIFDRPRGLRIIGLTQIAFGILGLVGFGGLIFATAVGASPVGVMGYTYAAVIFAGVVIPCLVIGNYVDDLRRWAVIAQVIYSSASAAISAIFIVIWGIGYHWTFPWFDFSFDVYIGNLAASILVIEAVFTFYLIFNWKRVVPPPGAVIERDRRRARLIAEGLAPSPLEPTLLGPDGETLLTPDETKRILDVRKVVSEEGMAILCSNCSGATPLTQMADDNTIVCDYCGVTLAVSSVFVPCEKHPEFLAATSCAVCGDFFCRRCLTAQEPPVDERWKGSNVYLCQKCFEGRYKPAVTTTSLVLPIDQLFGKAGGRFARVGSVYRRFLGAYSSQMKNIVEIAGRLAGAIAKSGGGGSSGDSILVFLIMVVVVIIAIPIIVGLILLASAIVIVPALFYAGLIGVTIEAMRIISRTDFISLDEAREKGLERGRIVTTKEPAAREVVRPWQDQSRSQKAPEEWKHVRDFQREMRERAKREMWER